MPDIDQRVARYEAWLRDEYTGPVFMDESESSSVFGRGGVFGPFPHHKKPPQ